MNWKNEFILQLKKNNYIEFDNYSLIWYNRSLKKTLSLSFHEKMPKGAALREFQNKHLHLSYWESEYYKNAIKGFIKEIDNPSERIVLDIGCGDGRFTELLLNLGYKKIIATDIDIKPLLSLHEYAVKNKFEENILIIRCNAARLPIQNDKVDIVLAIGVLYYLNEDFESSIKEIYRTLKPEGLLINSEPDLEGAIYKSAIFEEIEDFLENFNKKIFKEERGVTNYKFRLFEKEQIKTILSQNGFDVLDYHGLSLLPSILRIKMVRGELYADQIKAKESEIRRIFDYFDRTGSIFKHIIWKSIKKKSWD